MIWFAIDSNATAPTCQFDLDECAVVRSGVVGFSAGRQEFEVEGISGDDLANTAHQVTVESEPAPFSGKLAI